MENSPQDSTPSSQLSGTDARAQESASVTAFRRARPVVAIDGPSGAGKSTVSKRLAEQLGYSYIDTGAIYRAVALVAQRAGLEFSDEAGISALVSDLPISFQWSQGENRVLLQGVDETPAIRSEAMGLGASRVSSHPRVREGLLELQRSLGRDGGVVMDGRDIGTVIFPDAELKFYVVADPRERATRRFFELQAKGQAPDLARVSQDLATRDKQDMERPVAPLRQAPDAHYLDTTGMSIDEVVAYLVDAVTAWTQKAASAGHGARSPEVTGETGA